MSFFSCKHLKKSYGQDLIFSDINLSFPSKGLIGLIGESGSGKSTLINCLLGLEKCQGSIYLNDNKIKDFDKFRNETTFLIFQNFNLLENLSLKDNLLLINKKIDYSLVKRLKLDSILDKKCKYLSGGEKQRGSILRSLLKRPKIIFGDEVTGSLDEENSIIIMDIFKELSKDYLIILISHNLELITKYADKIIKLEKNLNIDYSDKVKINKNNKYKLSIPKIIRNSLFFLQKSTFKLVLSIISLVISISFFGVTYNIKNSLDDSINYLIRSNPDLNFIEISKTTETKINNSKFSLIKMNRPSLEDLEDIKYLMNNSILSTNIQKLINSYTLLDLEGEKIEIEFYPYLDEEENYYEMKVNKSAYSLIKDKTLSYELVRDISYKDEHNEIINDNIDIRFVIDVIEVTNELDLFEKPRIYYPYNAFLDYLLDINLINLSNHLNRRISLYNRLENLTYEGDYFNTGSIYLIYVNKIDALNNYSKLKQCEDNSNLSFTSRALDDTKIIIDLSSSITEGINIFIIISFIVSIIVLLLTLSSLIYDERKEISIYKSLGIRNLDIDLILLFQIIEILFMSFVISYILKYFFYSLIMNNFPILNLFSTNYQRENIYTLLLLLASGLLVYLVSYFLLKKIDPVKVLKED